MMRGASIVVHNERVRVQIAAPGVSLVHDIHTRQFVGAGRDIQHITKTLFTRFINNLLVHQQQSGR